jgi:hypothetical protein
MSYDDDFERQQQRRDEERPEQQRAEQRREEERREEQRRQQRQEEQRREDERRAEYDRQDVEIRRKQREAEDQRVMQLIRDHNMEGAFARRNIPFSQRSRVEPTAPSEAAAQQRVYRDLWTEAETLRQKMAGVLQTIAEDRYLSDNGRQFLAATTEVFYLDKIEPCLLAQLDQITREIADMQGRRLAFDPLRLQAHVQSQRLGEIESRRQAINQELQSLVERRQVLKQQTNESGYGNRQERP